MPRGFVADSLPSLLILLLFAARYCSAQADNYQPPTAEAIRGIAPDVFPADQRPMLRSMLPDHQHQRLQRANDTSSAAWRMINSREDWELFSDERLNRLQQSLGRFSAAPIKLDIRVAAERTGDGYRVRNLIFESQPGLWVTANMYLPAEPPLSMPGILICHSHHTPKEHGELQDMGMTWARGGCAVLVPDQLGHGERRQHDFRTESDFGASFRLSRQDYFFRYDMGIQLHLVGESLIGWLARDLMRGVDVLLAEPGIDPQRIILLGAVAGGGDPAAVAAALDQRITAAVPFNFGGPQPETQYPLPDAAESSFDYAGSGSWESTRNLRRSAADGFLPWVIVGSIAPRHLIYAHEFAWDRPHDPVWRRLQAIYGYFDQDECLAFTHGRGELKQSPPQATHCTHIGRVHREMIHVALQKWFDIQVGPEVEISQRRPVEELTCLTSGIANMIRPSSLCELLESLAVQRLLEARRHRQGLSPEEQREQLRDAFAGVLGFDRNQVPTQRVISHASHTAGSLIIDRVVLEIEPGIQVPMLLLLPSDTLEALPVVIGISQSGKRGFLENRAGEIAELLTAHIGVCLPDLRGTGETRTNDDRGRSGSDTSCSSTELMLGGTMVGARLFDLRAVLRYLCGKNNVAAGHIGLWGEAFTVSNPQDVQVRVPHDVDQRHQQSEPLGDVLGLIGALFFEPDICCVYSRGGLNDFASVLSSSYVLIPHDVVVPELLTIADFPEIATALTCPVRRDDVVDAANRLLPNRPATSPAMWLRDSLH